MKKKILVLLVPLFLLIPVSGVFASEDYFYRLEQDQQLIIDHELSIGDIIEITYIQRGSYTSHYVNFNQRLLTSGPSSNNHKLFTREFITEDHMNFYYKPVITFWLGLHSGFTYIHEILINDEIISLNEITVIEQHIGSRNDYRDLSSFPTDDYNLIFGEPIGDYTPPLEDIKDLTFITTHNRVDLNWSNANQDFFSHVQIYQDEILIEDNYFNENLSVTGLEPNQEYQFTIVSVDNEGKESEGVTVNVTTDPLPEIEEVKDVKVETDHDRVNLSWNLPQNDGFEHVNIYRKDMNNEDHTASIFDFLKPMTVQASADYQPLFQTNGTYFNDLSVQENSSYEYKLTTEYQGIESDGVIVQATTTVAPPPILSGENYEKQDNGDYLVGWDQPETGEVRILVDGSEYTTVPASYKQFTIPAGDMKYTSLGSPLVGLQTIGENGQESPPINPGVSNADLPFTVADLIITTNGLFLLIGSFLLLGLSFVFVPKLIKLIRSSFKNNGSIAKADREQSNYSIREEKAQTRSMRQVERAQAIGSGREPRAGRISLRQSRQPRQGRA